MVKKHNALKKVTGRKDWKKLNQEVDDLRKSMGITLQDFDKENKHNICGDRALHMCILTAYRYTEDSPARAFLIQLAKDLIQDWVPANEKYGLALMCCSNLLVGMIVLSKHLVSLCSLNEKNMHASFHTIHARF